MTKKTTDIMLKFRKNNMQIRFQKIEKKINKNIHLIIRTFFEKN